jgi:hypothetical protein
MNTTNGVKDVFVLTIAILGYIAEDYRSRIDYAKN